MSSDAESSTGTPRDPGSGAGSGPDSGAADGAIRRPGQERPRTLDEHVGEVAELVEATIAARTGRSETVPLADALDRVTAVAVASPVDLPLFRNSQMDGFAVRADDIREPPATLPIVGEIPARAEQPAPLAPGTTVRIMTGAVVPEGADAVIPVEHAVVEGGSAAFASRVAVGAYVRERGDDLRAGGLILPAGRRLGARHLAALAAAGIAEVEVTARVRVATLTTGAELVSVGDTPRLGEVHDSNAVALRAAVIQCGAEHVLAARVADDVDALAAALEQATAVADVVVTSGGISRGEHEVVRELLGPRGAWVGSVAMQPGGPQATAVLDGIPILCFPGNPVSTQLSFEVFLAPLLRAAAGLPAPERRRRRLAQALRSPAGRRQLLRGVLRDDGAVATVAGPGSHLVVAMAAADVLIDVPAETTEMSEGEDVETWLL